MGPLWRKKKKKKNPSGCKKAEKLLFKEIPMTNTSARVWKLQCLVATSELAVEISAKGRDEPVVRSLPEVKLKTPLLGVSSTDIPLQGASISSIPTAGEDLEHLVSG
jgi:hypothetical protein